VILRGVPLQAQLNGLDTNPPVEADDRPLLEIYLYLLRAPG